MAELGLVRTWNVIPFPRRPVAKPPAMRQPVSVVIPAHNEEQAIASVLADIPSSVKEVIVVDNACTDGTAAVARLFGARVVRQPERGYGAACLAGLSHVSLGSKVVVFLDGDYSDYPGDMNQLAAPILKGRADFVIGSRMLNPSARTHLLPQQRWGNWLAAKLIRLFFGHSYTDLGPFRAIRADALSKLGMSDRNFGWTVEMQIKAVRAGLRIEEIPARYRHRIGRSKISGTFKGTVMAGAKILYTIFRYGLFRRGLRDVR